MKNIILSILFIASDAFLFSTNVAAQSKPAFDGFYAGATLGYNQTSVSEGDMTARYNFPVEHPVYTANNGKSSKSDGLISGINLGYDHRIKNYLIGGEISLNLPGGTAKGYAAMDDATSPHLNAPIASKTSISSLVIAKSKFGLVLDNKTAVYGMAGIAMGKVKRIITDDSPIDLCGCLWWGNNSPVSNTQNKFGYTLGLGAETMLSDNLSLKLELNYVDLGSISSSYSIPVPLAGPGSIGSFQQSVRVTNTAATIGLSYKF